MTLPPQHRPDRPMTQNIDSTLDERATTYGKFSGVASITQKLKEVIRRNTPGMCIRPWPRQPDSWEVPFLAPDQEEALDMICSKIGRILNGDPNHADSWHDIAGYAQLVADRINGVER